MAGEWGIGYPMKCVDEGGDGGVIDVCFSFLLEREMEREMEII